MEEKEALHSMAQCLEEYFWGELDEDLPAALRNKPKDEVARLIIEALKVFFETLREKNRPTYFFIFNSWLAKLEKMEKSIDEGKIFPDIENFKEAAELRKFLRSFLK